MSSTDPLVTTDQSDYAPGSTATITAAGFGIGDPLNFQITVIDPATQAVLWSGPSWVAAEGSDANGNGWLVTSFFVNPWYANTTIQLTVTDALTGQAATDVYTDSPTPLFPVPPLVAPVIPDTSADLAYQANIIANYDTVDAHGTPTGPNANDPGGSFTDGSLNVLNLTFPGASAAANGALFDQALHVVGGAALTTPSCASMPKTSSRPSRVIIPTLQHRTISRCRMSAATTSWPKSSTSTISRPSTLMEPPGPVLELPITSSSSTSTRVRPTRC